VLVRLPLLFALLLPAAAQDQPAAPAMVQGIRPEAWCRYLYDVHKYSWRGCLTAPVVPYVLLNEASDGADDRKSQVAALARKLERAESADEVKAVLAEDAVKLDPPLNERTFSAWLGNPELDDVQLKLRLALPRLKNREPLPVVDVKRLERASDDGESFQRWSALLDQVNAAMSRFTGPRRGKNGRGVEVTDSDLALPKALAPVTDVRFSTGLAQAPDADARQRARQLHDLFVAKDEAPLTALAGGAARAPGAEPAAPGPNEAACADFYDYACGEWDSAHPRWTRRDQAAATALARLRQLLASPDAGPAADFYAACLQPQAGAGVEALKTDAARLSSLRAKSQLAEELARLHRLGVDALLRLDAGPDPADPSTTLAFVRREARAASGARVRRRAEELFIRMGEDAGAAQRDAAAAASLAERLAALPPSGTPTRLEADDLDRRLKPLGWRRYLAALGVPAGPAVVDDADSLAAAAGLIERRPLAEWSAYLRWRLLDGKSWLLPEELSAGGEGPRWRACLEGTLRLFPETLAKAYLDRFVAAHDRNQVAAVANAARAALRHRLSEQAWLSAGTRDEALRKLSALAVRADPQAPAAAPPPMDRADALADDYALERAAAARRLAAVGQPLDRSGWSVDLGSAAVAVDAARAAAVVSPALLQPPFFGGADPADAYGGLGAALADALADAVAGDGRHTDADGRQRDWWASYDAARLDLRAQCLPAGAALDDLGLRAAYAAFEAQRAPAQPGETSDWRRDQEFFLAYARSRCGGVTGERLNAALGNLTEFRRAFQCGDPAAAPRCEVW